MYYANDVQFDILWDYLRDYMIATEEEMSLVCCINGQSVDTLNDILYVRTGYRDWQQFQESEIE